MSELTEMMNRLKDSLETIIERNKMLHAENVRLKSDIVRLQNELDFFKKQNSKEGWQNG